MAKILKLEQRTIRDRQLFLKAMAPSKAGGEAQAEAGAKEIAD